MKYSGISLIFGLLLLLLTGNAAAQGAYIGEVCLVVGEEIGDEGTTVRLAAYDMGDSHFLITGVELREGGNPSVISDIYHGNGEIIGSEAVLAIDIRRTTAEEFSTGSVIVKISLISLSGVLDGVITTYDKGAEESIQEYISGVVAPTSCPG